MSQTLPERRTEAAPERWEPQGELEQVSERMRRILEQTFGGFGWASPLIDKAGVVSARDPRRPMTRIVEAELPGVKREDVNVELVGNELTISARPRSASGRNSPPTYPPDGSVRLPHQPSRSRRRRDDRGEARRRRPHGPRSQGGARSAPSDRDQVVARQDEGSTCRPLIDLDLGAMRQMRLPPTR